MARKLRLVLLFILLNAFLLSPRVQIRAQQAPTFGPTCQAGVTCAPTVTITPRPTLPVTGGTSVVVTVLAGGIALFFIGIGAYWYLAPAKR